MSTSANAEKPAAQRLTLVIRSVPELSPDLANTIYEAAGGECEIAMRDQLLYIELGSDVVDAWATPPRLLAAVQTIVPEAELLRVEVADMITATERAHEPLRSSA